MDCHRCRNQQIRGCGMSDDGSNPMLHRCDIKGCFNIKKRPKIEIFAQCFPKKIGASDIDGVIEQNFRFMFIEWKSHLGELPKGQHILFERLTLRYEYTFVMVLCGDAETMEITHMKRIYRGKFGDWEPMSTPGVLTAMSLWSDWTVAKIRDLEIEWRRLAE